MANSKRIARLLMKGGSSRKEPVVRRPGDDVSAVEVELLILADGIDNVLNRNVLVGEGETRNP